jgi:ribose 5-phosphate isomerase B
LAKKKKEKIAIGCDHAAVKLKNKIAALVEELGYNVIDVGTNSDDSVDYPNYAAEVARRVSRKSASRGILICGTGIGMSIAANKFPGVRAALVTDPFMAEMAAMHNNANLLCLGARTKSARMAPQMVEKWLSTSFEKRHGRRLNIISAFERAFGTKIPTGWPIKKK